MRERLVKRLSCSLQRLLEARSPRVRACLACTRACRVDSFVLYKFKLAQRGGQGRVSLGCKRSRAKPKSYTLNLFDARAEGLRHSRAKVKALAPQICPAVHDLFQHTRYLASLVYLVRGCRECGGGEDRGMGGGREKRDREREREIAMRT